MSDEWDFYALLVEDEPASICVDLGIQSEAPIEELPHMAYVRLFMRQPRSDGLSSSEEFDTLVAIEDRLKATLGGDSTRYVGRNTCGGSRDFYFYVATPSDWEASVAQAMSPFVDYEYEAGSSEDTGWSVYSEFLLPGPRDRQRIENRRVCAALERHGDKLTVAREIDHWSVFPDEAAADAYLEEVRTLGFHCRARFHGDADAPGYVVRVWRSDVPSYEQIDDVTLPLFEAAARHGGDYDGWECAVEA